MQVCALMPMSDREVFYVAPVKSIRIYEGFYLIRYTCHDETASSRSVRYCMVARRQFVIALAGGAFAPLVAFAQQKSKTWRVGFFYNGSRQSALDTGRYAAFLRGMRDLGYIEGQHFVVDERFV